MRSGKRQGNGELSEDEERACAKSWFEGEKKGFSFKYVTFGVNLETHKTIPKESKA